MSRDHLKSNRIALFVSRDLQPAVLNRAVHKQSLSNTVLITDRCRSRTGIGFCDIRPIKFVNSDHIRMSQAYG